MIQVLATKYSISSTSQVSRIRDLVLVNNSGDDCGGSFNGADDHWPGDESRSSVLGAWVLMDKQERVRVTGVWVRVRIR